MRTSLFALGLTLSLSTMTVLAQNFVSHPIKTARSKAKASPTGEKKSADANLRELEKSLLEMKKSMNEMQETILNLTAEIERFRAEREKGTRAATDASKDSQPVETVALGAKSPEAIGAEQQQILQAQQKRLEALEQMLAAIESKNAGSPTPATPSQTPAPQSSVSKEITREGFGIKFYGFLRADLAADSNRMSVDPQLPFFVLSPADPSQSIDRTGDLTIHPRLTRFGIDITPPPLPGGWAANAKLETDFYNTIVDRPAAGGPLARDLVSNSRAAIRIRLAYVQASKGALSLLAGQNWDLISPLFPSYNPEVVMWNGGNTGDRRPQFRVTYEPPVGKGKFSIAGEIGASGAVDGQDLDGDGFRDGETAVTPTGQLRVGYSAPLNGGRWSIGGWAHGAKYHFNRSLIAGRKEYGSNLIGMDFSVPVLTSLTFRGEAWTGKGLSDVRGGIGQSLNTATGEVISASGGWAELSYRPNSFYTVSIGTTLDNPDASDITAANGRVRNRVHYITNRFNAKRGLSFGVDYGNWETRFKGLPAGKNNRFNLFVQQSF